MQVLAGGRTGGVLMVVTALLLGAVLRGRCLPLTLLCCLASTLCPLWAAVLLALLSGTLCYDVLVTVLNLHADRLSAQLTIVVASCAATYKRLGATGTRVVVLSSVMHA
jgi:hypothetical protein